jgi:hypothetical protein
MNVDGKAKFGKRSMILSLNSGRRIDFLYSAVESITTEIEPTPCFILSMQQNPRLFNEVEGPIRQAANLLGLMNINVTTPSSRPGYRNIERYRIASLGSGHQPIAGNCLAYRVQITSTTTIGRIYVDDNSTKMYKLEKAPETPRMI